MKSYKTIMPILLVAALVLTAFYSIQTKMDTASAYNQALAQARNYADKGVVSDAVEQYEVALGLNPSFAIQLEEGQVYLDNDDLSSAQKYYTRTLLASYPKEPETYLYGLKVYLAQGNYKAAFGVYDSYLGCGVTLEEVETLISTIQYEYDLKGNFSDVSPYSNVSGTAAVAYNGAWGYVDASGDKAISYSYQKAGVFGTYAAVVDSDGVAYYIDANGNEKINEAFLLEKDPDFGQLVDLQSIQSDLILAYNGEVWNYYNANTYEKVMGGYADAYPVTNGVGAVADESGKWALITADGTQITDYLYDEVVADEKGLVCRTDAVIVKLDGAYILVDHEGNQIGSGSYESACGFNDSTYAAVEKNGQWLFVDPAGNEVNLGEYDGARSFSNGLAAVEQDGLWGYIDTEGNLVIPCAYEDAGPFHSTGVAFVKTSADTWRLLMLYAYNH
ncbi:MAG: WG repeat-containing protein [Clostridiales bacterium]|nr:WG repeat-containing protein [Clostridiales bacterium]